MGVKVMHANKLKETLCDELERISARGELSRSDLEIVHKLTDTIKNLLKIEALESDGYKHHREDSKHSMMERIDRLMRDATAEERDILSRCLARLERE